MPLHFMEGMMLQHALNIAGINLLPIVAYPKPGHTVTKVDWNGCMATIRKVVDVGDLVRYEKRKGYKGILIKYDKLGLKWEPLDHLRIVNGEAEVWS